MPLYPYRCTQCGHKFEKIQNFSAEPETVCPKCGGGPLERPLTAPRLNFKGAGWYVNDYAPKSSGSSESSSESSSSESKPDSKSDSKSETKTESAAPAAPSAPAAAPSSSTTPSSGSSSTT